MSWIVHLINCCIIKLLIMIFLESLDVQPFHVFEPMWNTSLSQGPVIKFSWAIHLNTKVYMCYELQSGNIITSRHVEFHDNFFPFLENHSETNFTEFKSDVLHLLPLPSTTVNTYNLDPTQPLLPKSSLSFSAFVSSNNKIS